MPTFILMTKLSSDISAKMKQRETLGNQWLEEVKAKCPEVRFVSHYGLLGRWDFMDIFEAPSEEIAAKVSMISLKNGAFQSESWVAIPYKKVLELAKEI